MLITPIPAPGKGETPVAERVLGWLALVFLITMPRLIILGFWVFSDLVGKAIDSTAVCILGFIFLPTTTLAYAIMWSVSSDKVSGAEWLVVVLGFLIDIGIWLGTWVLARR